MPSNSLSQTESVRAGLAQFLPDFAEIYRSARGQGARLREEIPADQGFQLSWSGFADRFTASPDKHLFPLLADGRVDPLNSGLVSLLKAKFSHYLDSQIRQLPGGGTIVRLPNGEEIAIGARSLREDPRIERAAVVIHSRSVFVYKTPHLDPMSDSAIVNGKKAAFKTEIASKWLRVVRENDFEATIYYGGNEFARVSLFENYASQVRALSDPAQFVTAWMDYLEQTLNRIVDIQRLLASVLDRSGGIKRPSNAPTPADMAPILQLFDELRQIINSTTCFTRAKVSLKSWEGHFVSVQTQNLRNKLNDMYQLNGLLKDGSLTNRDLATAGDHAADILKPLAYLYKSFLPSDETQRWLKIKLPASLPKEPLSLNPIPLREIVDKIVLCAGQNGPASIDVGYDDRMERLIFADASRGEGREPFAEFKEGGEGRLWLEFLVNRLGSSAAVEFRKATDDPDRVAAIEVVLPSSSGTSDDGISLMPPLEEGDETGIENAGATMPGMPYSFDTAMPLVLKP
ncbi:MAG: hypothetical protein WC956_00665 [bacterium]